MARLAILLLLAMPALAGVCDNTLPAPRNEFRFFAGFSPDSPTIFGSAADRKLAIGGFSYSYLCRTLGPADIAYTATLMPAAILIQPRRIAGGRAVYGFAVTPLGTTVDFRRGRKVQPFAELRLGIIASTRPIPIPAPNATGLNFLISLAGGVRWNLSPRSALRFGYNFLHISNANTTNFNPGLDNNVLFIGYSFFR